MLADAATNRMTCVFAIRIYVGKIDQHSYAPNTTEQMYQMNFDRANSINFTISCHLLAHYNITACNILSITFTCWCISYCVQCTLYMRREWIAMLLHSLCATILRSNKKKQELRWTINIECEWEHRRLAFERKWKWTRIEQAVCSK